MKQNLAFFITATDTDVGKTFVTTSLLKALIDNGKKACAIKPIETGFTNFKKSDTGKYFEITGKEILPFYTFSFPGSPHMCSKLENKKIDTKKIVCLCKKYIDSNEITLIEGAGGIMVPINHKFNFANLVKNLDIAVILVAPNRLGGLNNLLLNINFLLSQNIKIAAIILNNHNQNDKNHTSNLQFIQKQYKFKIITIPNCKNIDCCAPYFLEFINSIFQNKRSKNIERNILEFDKKHLFHPYTSATNPLKTIRIVHAKGKYIFTEKQKLLEAMGSWWCTNLGYNRDDLKRAAISQINNFSHVMFGGITHDNAVNLGKKLLKIMPEFDYIFYSDSGSVSVEVAIKMALQYQQKKDPNKVKIMTALGGYHGDTFGAMSICDPINGMHSKFFKTLPKQIFFKKPDCGFYCDFKEEYLQDFKLKFQQHKDEIAAIIIEPIVQGAGGMNFYHKEYLNYIQDICNKEDVVLIFDEIATGFGRTGELFAYNYTKAPDIICIGKGLSGGFMSFAATLTNKKIAHTISRDNDVFMHGPTFMANPLACAVALENINTLLKYNWKKQVNNIQNWLNNYLKPCLKLDVVRDVRVIGAIGVVELKYEVNMQNITSFFIKNGVWLRPFGKLIYTMPHFNFNQNDIKKISQVIFDAINCKDNIQFANI